MILTLVVLVGAAVSATLANLDFSHGRLTHWEGKGFSLGPARGSGPSMAFAACSSDRGRRGRKALLHRTFVIPAGTAAIRFRAAAFRPAGVPAADGLPLDVVLEAANRVFVPKRVWTAGGYADDAALLPPGPRCRLPEYVWDVSAHAGKHVRIAIVDDDDRPGCFVACGGFRLVSSDTVNAGEFVADMRRLQKAHRLAPVARFDTRHFIALSTASEGYTEYRLSNCETIYALFFDHFRRRGFAAREPGMKMMVAVFDSQAGFEAYLGHTMPDAVTGVYHPPSNRLVVYDYASNRGFRAGREKGKELVRNATNDLERERLAVAVNRFYQDRRDDTNISTVMHEVAHQLSFNGGLLNRGGDVPLWLAEGLACYCESTVKGAWQGIGEANPQRAAALAGPARRRAEFIPLKALVGSDDWLRKASQVDQVLLGYGQSWALFDWMMRDRRAQLRHYLEIIRDRRTPDHRLADFAAAFGDLTALEKQYHASVRETVRQQVRER